MRVNDMFKLLFDECKHGDLEHQDWLEGKFSSFQQKLGIEDAIITNKKRYEVDDEEA